MSQSRLEWKLEALKFPYGWRDSDMNTATLRQMVVWLEDTVLRWLDPDQRGPLKDTEDEAEWFAAFTRYLKDMGYTKPVSFTLGQDISTERTIRAAVDWVVGKAIRFKYSDDHGKYNKAHSKYSSLGMSIVTKIQDPEALMDNELHYDVTDQSGMKVVVDRVLEMLKLPPNGDLEGSLMLIARTVSDIRCMDALPERHALPTADEILSQLPAEGLQDVDPAMEKAVKLLRLLFVMDITELQRRITEIFCELQGITHNIKVDVRAGVVGS